MTVLSKKDRLRKQKEKQLELLRLEEQEEKAFKKSFTESKTARKYKKSKDKASQPLYYLILKLSMLVPFLWSGFFWGGVLSIAILWDIVNDYGFSPVSNKTAIFIIVGVGVMAAALVFEFLKKHLVGFVLSLTGVLIYLNNVNDYIKPITEYLKTKAVDPALAGMDKKWMTRCYPIWAFAVISFAIFVIDFVIKRVKARKEKEKRDNAPVKSIVSD